MAKQLPYNRVRGRSQCAAVVALLCVPLLATSPAQEHRTAREEEVRAAFLFHLAQFVSWPPDKAGNAPVRFCVLRDGNMVQTLNTAVSGKTVQNRPVEVVAVENVQSLPACHLAFLGTMRPKDLQQFVEQWPYPPVLLVGDSERFAEHGGMVNLVIASGKVSFEVNLATLQRARLSLRSQLLRFATIVGPDKEPRK